MDCRTAEGMVSSYIEHKLPVNELEEFLDHVESCSSCYDELETYFIVHEDGNGAYFIRYWRNL